MWYDLSWAIYTRMAADNALVAEDLASSYHGRMEGNGRGHVWVANWSSAEICEEEVQGNNFF